MLLLHLFTVFTMLLNTDIYRMPSALADPDDVSQILGVANGTISIPCDLTAPILDEEAVLVLWYRDDSITPFYSWDARGTTFLMAKHWSDGLQLNERAFFHYEEPSGLTIDKLQKRDEGTYKCRVDFHESPTKIYRSKLRVIVPPHTPTIMDEKHKNILSVLGPYNEGDDLRIICESRGGDPVPKLTWWRSDLLIDTTYQEELNGLVRNKLEVKNLGRKDLHSVYSCKAANNNLTSPAVRDVTLDMNFKPLSVEILGNNQALSEGKTYNLVCKALGSRPPAKIIWWKNGKRLKKTKELTSPDGNTTSSTLTFTATLDDMGKTLTCQAENTEIANSTIEVSWTLAIHFKPKTELQMGRSLHPDNIQEYDDIYFECTVKANPWIFKVTWQHNGVPLEHNIRNGVIISNQSLVIQRITRQHAGLYSCIATNSEGDGESNVVLVSIKFAPVCKEGQKITYGIAKLEEAKVMCEVEALPDPHAFMWKFNNTSGVIDIIEDYFQINGSKSIVTYTPMTENDYGSLLCWGVNRVGRQMNPCVFHVIPAGKPDPLYHCNISNQSVNFLQVQCTGGFDGGLPQHFVMEVYDAHSQKLKNTVISNTPEFTVHNLEPGMELLVSLYATNEKGKSNNIIIRTTTLKVAEKRTGPSDISFPITPVLAILIGIVSALLLLVVVIIIIMKFRTRPHKDHPKKLTIQEKLVVVEKEVEVDHFELDDKNPDIIPQKNDPDYVEYGERRAIKANAAAGSIYGTLDRKHCFNTNQHGSLCRREITYAELTLPRMQHYHQVRREDQILYATIDHARKPDNIPLPPKEFQDPEPSVNTPLINNSHESSV